MGRWKVTHDFVGLAFLVTEFETLRADWLSYEEALACLISAAGPTDPEVIFVGAALGRYLLQPIRARATLPSWDNSAMDGYALKGSDLDQIPVRLKVVYEALPGSVPGRPVEAGEAVRIMTGGPMPPGADTVVRVEHTDSEETLGSIEIRSPDDLHRNVRPAGQDMAEGDITVEVGAQVTSGTVAVALASGSGTITVGSPCRVGVLSSGDELAGQENFSAVQEGRAIPDTNGPMIAAAVSSLGGTAIPLGVVSDDEAAIIDVLESMPPLDLLITTGGASMGEHDLFKRTLLAKGLDLDFWRARIRPGSPVSFGRLPTPTGELPLLGLPGNPASAFVTFYVLGAPFIRAAMGAARPTLRWIRATAGSTFRSPNDLTQFFRVRLRQEGLGLGGGLGGQLIASSTGPQGSGLVTSLAHPHGFLVSQAGVDRVNPGDDVSVMLLPGNDGWDQEPEG